MPSQALKKNSSSPLPEWYNAYFTAVLETDERKAAIQFKRAVNVMEDRVAQLRCNTADHCEELQDLASALTYLRLLLENMNVGQEDPDDSPALNERAAETNKK